MFSKLVRSSVPSNFLILPLVFIIGWWSVLADNYPVYNNSGSVVFGLFPQIFSSPLWSHVVTVIFIMLTAVLMIPFSSKYLNSVSGNSLPSFLFIILISIHYWVYGSSPAVISIFFLMIALYNIFETYNLNRVYNLGFMSGFYSAIASLIYFPAISFVIISWVGFILLRTFKIREFLIIMLGFLVPVILTHALFMVNGEEKLFFSLIETASVKIKPSFNGIEQIVLMILMGLFLLWSIIKPVSSGGLKKVILQRYFQTLVAAIAICILVYFIRFSDFGLVAIALLPLSFIMAISITSIKKQRWVSILLFVLIIFQVVAQLKNVF